jgi:tetraacyldisaccharide 4'-kinase
MSVNPWQNRLSPILGPLGRIYSFCVARKQEFALGKSKKFPIPTISIGNISMGGTGKTPFCEFLAGHLAKNGIKGVILSRGYKSKSGSYPRLVDAGDDPAICGDEPLMMARSLRGRFQVVVDPLRLRGGNWALENLDPDVFILDDGFQHVRVKRDLNMLLLTPCDLEQGWNRVFPAGMWREDKKALGRADMFMINTWGQDAGRIKKAASKRENFLRGPVFYFNIEVEGLEDQATGEKTAGIETRDYLLVTGVANPGKVYNSAEKLLGYPPREHLAFADHYEFGPDFRQKIRIRAQKAGISDILCTTKDAVKIKPDPELKFWVMLPRINILENQAGLLFQRLKLFLP